jgi:hypothetical protein
MKVYAQFDTAGKIKSMTVLDAPDEFSAVLVPKSGTFVAEVEGIRISEGDLKDPAKLREIVGRYKSVKTFPHTRIE